MRGLLLVLSLPLLGQAPRFTVRDAIQAEWARQPLVWTEVQKAALPAADRARLERTLARIGAPGAPALLPPELENPTLAGWEDKAKTAHTPQERFTALFMLNRLKSPKALSALEGLMPADAANWPKHLHLEASLATARLNGSEVFPALRAFLDARQKAGKVDPVRAQAAQLILVMAGKEQALLPLVPATPGSVMTLMDALLSRPAEARDPLLKRLWLSDPPSLNLLGLMQPAPEVLAGKMTSAIEKCFAARLATAIPANLTPNESEHFIEIPLLVTSTGLPPLQYAALDGVKKFRWEDLQFFFREIPIAGLSQQNQGTVLPALRKLDPSSANALRDKLLFGASPIARAAAIEDLPTAPADLKALTNRCWADTQFEAQQTLLQSYPRWKMSPEEQKVNLRPWLQHPDWACRWEAYQALAKLDPATPWPAAPTPTKTDEAILKEATRLAERAKPVRLRITFSETRSVTLRLNPAVAPINVANLVLLARKGFFDGRLVPRVVPDFVVQMGSPYDTMDGGPGYTVRCEDSLDWYGPGSVGMALAGKDTGGSQFFITTNATPHLTGKYTRVGEVEDLDQAMKILDDLELGAKILSVKVLEL
jgi:cyclophilin family peptidyl-prolyl cis-trans isomerase